MISQRSLSGRLRDEYGRCFQTLSSHALASLADFGNIFLEPRVGLSRAKMKELSVQAGMPGEIEDKMNTTRWPLFFRTRRTGRAPQSCYHAATSHPASVQFLHRRMRLSRPNYLCVSRNSILSTTWPTLRSWWDMQNWRWTQSKSRDQTTSLWRMRPRSCVRKYNPPSTSSALLQTFTSSLRRLTRPQWHSACQH